MTLNIDRFLVVLLGALLFLPFLGSVHLFDWDELNFAEAAREMLVSGDWLNVTINFEPFYEKPPLFIWLQALSMSVFGVGEFAARFPNAICGILTLLIIFNFGFALKGRRFAWIWVGLYTASLLPHFYFKSGIIDPWFNLFIFLAVWQLFDFFNSNSKNIRLRPWVLSGIFLGLAILTKGPVAIIVWGMVAFFLFLSHGFRKFPGVVELLVFGIVLILVGGSWFGAQWMSGNGAVIWEFIRVQKELFSTGVAGHEQPFYYHTLVLLFGCFPASFLALPVFFSRLHPSGRERILLFGMKVFFLVVLVLFSIVKTKIVHYSSLTYFAITFLAAYSVVEWDRLKSTGWIKAVGVLILAVVSATISLIPLLDKYKKEWLPWESMDEFTRANLMVDPGWSGWEWILGVVFFLFGLWFIIKLHKSIGKLLVLSTMVVAIFIYAYPKKIERITQNSAIGFYKSLSGKPAYIRPLYMKSYGYLFYSQYPNHASKLKSNEHWLLTGDIDKDAYFILRNKDVNRLDTLSEGLTTVDERGGYVLLKRAKPEN